MEDFAAMSDDELRAEFRDELQGNYLMALAGALTGGLLAILCVYLFRNLIIQSLSVPFMLPSVAGLLAVLVAGVLLGLLCVGLAAMLPALRISRLEPAQAMRE